MKKSRLTEEQQYWDECALDNDVDIKYISDAPTDLCLADLGILTGKVLEIGCGVGRLLKDGYYGIDISAKMLKVAHKRKPKCKYKHTDGRSIPFEDESFDVVYSYLVFQHIPKEAVAEYIKESYRVLRPGGRLIFQCILGTEQEPFSKHLDFNWVKEQLNIYMGHYAQQSYAHKDWMIFKATK